MNFNTNFPELNPTQIKILYRVLSEEVIGSDEDAMGMILPPDGTIQVGAIQTSSRNQLKAAQRKRLANYLEIKEEV